MRTRFERSAVPFLAFSFLSAVSACAQPGRPPVRSEETGQAGSLAYDRGLWHELLADNAKIRRSVAHSASGVEAVTESDDPQVAARIIDHAKAMQTRMKSGARVRVWDPVFRELFDNHEKVTIVVTPTEKGVRITESSDDPEVVALLRSHAMGVSEFVRAGFDAAPRNTPRFRIGDPIPMSEVAIGGSPHRLLLGQPDAASLAALKASGVTGIVNFRHESELGEFDESAAAAERGLTYCNLPYKPTPELTDELIDSARRTIREAGEQGRALALHCRTGNRVGPAWIAYRVLDQRVPIEQAVAEAKMAQLVNAEYEARARAYIAARSPSAAEQGR